MLRDALESDLAALAPAERPRDWQSGKVTGVARFDFVDTESREVAVEITAEAAVPQVCQRSLEAFEYRLAIDAKLLLAAGTDAPERDGYETWEVEGDRIRPIDLVDELLVMALPFAAKLANDKDRTGVLAETAEASDTVRPFADLKAQMEAASSPDEPAGD